MRVVAMDECYVPSLARVLHEMTKCEQNRAAVRLPPRFVGVALPAENYVKKEARMASHIETWTVRAFNTAKQSENKMHDDAVAQRFGFSGGLVPGVDVMAYMMHMPVAKWGRVFLERGLIEARFLKPVYDGEIADVTAEEKDGVLALTVE